MAVVSLVLSLLWLAGLGSILAVIFGLVARHQLRTSKAAEEGEGIALAGVIIGAFGILGAVLTAALLIQLDKHVIEAFSPQTNVLQMGQAASLQWIDAASGVRKVTIYSFESPVTSANAPKLKGGKVYAVADVQVCAGATGASASDFMVMLDLPMPGTLPPSSSTKTDARQPALSAVGTIGPNACVRGFVTFAIPGSVRPTTIEYLGVFHSYRWKIAPG
jgi:hypothetical protein